NASTGRAGVGVPQPETCEEASYFGAEFIPDLSERGRSRVLGVGGRVAVTHRGRAAGVRQVARYWLRDQLMSWRQEGVYAFGQTERAGGAVHGMLRRLIFDGHGERDKVS